MDKSHLPRLSAGRRITLVFAVSALAGIVLVGAALMYSIERAALAQCRTYLESQAGMLVRQCENEIAGAQRDLVYLSKMPAFQQLPYVDRMDPAINGVPENVDVEKRQFLTLTLNRTERFSALYVLRPNADIYMVEPFKLQPKLAKNNLADRPYYQEAVRTKGVVVSDGFLGADGILAVVILAPILAESGDVTGYLSGAFHLTQLSQLVSKERITPYDAGFMVDRKGYLIAHTDVGLLKEGVRERFAQHPLVSRFLSSGGDPAEKSQGAIFLDDCVDPTDAKHYLAAFVPLRSGWGLALLRDRDSVAGEVQPVIWRITGLAALLFFVVSGMGVAIAQRIGRRGEAAERALRASEVRFRIVAESVSDMIYEWDLKDKVDWHGDVDGLVGYPAGGFPRTMSGWVAGLHPEDKDRVLAAVDGQIKGTAPYNVEFRVAGKDGGWQWWSSRGTVLRDGRGEPRRWLGAVTDITERKRAEERITHLNAVLRAIRDINQLIVKEKDRDGLLRGVCQNLIETRGYGSAWIALLDESGKLTASAEAGIGGNFASVAEPLTRGTLPECGRRVLAQPDVWVADRVDADCPPCPLARVYSGSGGMAVRLEHGGKVYGFMTVSIPAAFVVDEEEKRLFREVSSDIAFALNGLEVETERKKAEEALELQAAELRARNEELERFNSAGIGRELRMVELKRQINELSHRLGQPPPYSLDFAGDTGNPSAAESLLKAASGGSHGNEKGTHLPSQNDPPPDQSRGTVNHQQQQIHE